MATLTFGDKLL